MTSTNNYGLKKPEQTDFYNVDDFNSNMDVLDAKIKEMETAFSQKEILRFGSKADFPAAPTPEQEGCLFIDQSTNKIWHWTGDTYAEIFAGVPLGETPDTAYPGDKGKTAYEHSQMVGNPHNATASDVGARPDTWLPTAADIGAASEEVINGHVDKSVNNEAGVHGLRFKDNRLEYFDGADWKEIKTGNRGGVAPGNIDKLFVTDGNGLLNIRWSDPEDDVWAGTKVLRKTGSYPSDMYDGDLVVDNQTKNAFAVNGYIDSGLTNGMPYYYHLFPYSKNDDINSSVQNRIRATPAGPKIYGVKIDTTNSDPLTAVTYTDDAAGLDAGSPDWEKCKIFRDIKPCVLKNGTVQYYLSPADYSKKIDGSSADIESGNDGDVMVEIPKTGFKIWTDGNYLNVQITDNENAAGEGFKYYAHTREIEGDRNKLYIGAYLGYQTGSRLHSLSGKTPTGAATFDNFRTWATANGGGYDLLSFYPLTLLQCLYLIKYKNLNSQAALGMGYTMADNGLGTAATGGTNKQGLDWGESTAKMQMKLFGIEDLWGNLFCWLDGLCYNSSGYIMTAFQGFNGSGSGYSNRGSAGVYDDAYGYITKVQGKTETGFFPTKLDGAEGTYWSDRGSVKKGYNTTFGASYNNGSFGGLFALNTEWSSSRTSDTIGGRLMYL